MNIHRIPVAILFACLPLLSQDAPATRSRVVPFRHPPLVTSDSVLPPTLVSARPLNAQFNHIVLQWTHPTVYEFQIRMQSPDQENANLIRFEHRGHYEKEESHGLTNFLEKIKLTQPSSVFSVRAIVGTNVSAWSNPIAVVTSIDNKP